MFTTGSKLLIGATALTAALAVVYGVAQGGALGTIGLVFAAIGLAVLAGTNVFLRDSNISALDDGAFSAAAANQTTGRPSLWPLLTGVGATLAAAGLVTNSVVFVLGCGVIFAAAAEWMIQAWSEHVSLDAEFNSEVRQQFANPLELPVGGAILAGVVVFAFSRVMLGLPSKSATVIAFSVVAALVLAAGVIVGTKRTLRAPAMIGTLAVGVTAIAVVGAVYGLNGSREIHAHETTTDLAAHDECGSEETHADERASQTVAAKSNAAAELHYDGSSLVADVPGLDGQFEQLTLPRGTPNHLLFRNDSGEPARLVIDLHPITDPSQTDPVIERVCTALVEDGGVQFMAVTFGPNSAAIEAEHGEGYKFAVAGSDATLDVVVP